MFLCFKQLCSYIIVWIVILQLLGIWMVFRGFFLIQKQRRFYVPINFFTSWVATFGNIWQNLQSLLHIAMIQSRGYRKLVASRPNLATHRFYLAHMASVWQVLHVSCGCCCHCLMSQGLYTPFCHNSQQSDSHPFKLPAYCPQMFEFSVPKLFQFSELPSIIISVYLPQISCCNLPFLI